MTPSYPGRPSRTARGRILSLALIIFGGLVLLLNPAAEARAQTPTPTPTADLTVSKSGDESATVGGTITYNLVVSNGGPDTATNVVLTDPIPAHTTFVGAESPYPSPDPPPGGTVSFSNNTLTVTFDSIPAFESRSAKLVVQVNLDTPRGTVISNTVTGTASSSDPISDDNSATALTVVTGPFAGDILISEFRLRGPGGASDEYIEVYNNADAPHKVQSTDGSDGYAVAASDGVIRCTIKNGTVIPARGHFLCVNEVGYSLDTYPAGDSERPTATGDATYTADILDNAGVAVFSTSNTENFDLVHRLDAAGSTSELNTVYKEGKGYPALSPLGLDYALYRDLCGKAGSPSDFGNCPTAGLPRDSNDNAVDFVFVSPDGNTSGAGRRLGAPGPENFGSPTQRNSSFGVNLLDPCVGSASPPNRVRSFTSDPTNNSTFGTIDIRRTVTNNTGQDVTRLRWRIIDISTFPAPEGVADLRARTSGATEVVVDRAPCGSDTSSVTVQGTTLEEALLPQSLGGGFNSSLSSGTITLETPLPSGESINVRFLLGVQQTGQFKFFVNVEALTRDPTIIVPPEPESIRLPASAPAAPTLTTRKGVTASPSTPSAGTSARPSAGTSAQPAPATRSSKKSAPATRSSKPAAQSPAGNRNAGPIARDRLRHDF